MTRAWLMRVWLSAFLLLAHGGHASAQTSAEWQASIAKALFIDQPLPALDAQSYGSFGGAKHVRVEQVSFATQFGMRVPAIVYVPQHVHGKLPAMVVVAGHGGDKTSWYEVYTGLLYASAGAVVVTYDPAGEGERNTQRASDTRLHDEPTGLRHPERVGGLMVEDAIQAMRYAESRPDVDPSRIALLGYSMGMLHAVMAAAIHPPHALLLSAGGNLDGPGQYWETGNKLNCQVAPYKSLAFLEDRGAAIYAHLAATTATLIMNGAQDGLITKFDEQEPWFSSLRSRIAALDSAHAANLPQTFFDSAAGHRPAFAERPAALWLNEQLHFPRWTEAKIEAFPLTTAHIWASTHSVRIAPAYDNNLQEGGVPILDLHLPGLKREQLMAIPLDIWSREQSLYDWKSWKVRALDTEVNGQRGGDQ